MKKVGVLVAIFFLALAAFTFKSVTQAKAANTCKDNCASVNGHCTWQDAGGTIYVCPAKFDKKQHQE